MKVEEYINSILKRDGVAHFTLLDPAKQDPREAVEITKQAEKAKTDALMIGGSIGAGQLVDITAKEIKKEVKLPLIAFPSNASDVCSSVDAIFFMSLLNSTNPYYITGAQALGALLVKKYKIEPIPMAYLIVEPGGAAGWVGEAKLIPRDKSEIAVAYSLAAQYFGFRFVYLEAGSGADQAVPVSMVHAVKKSVSIPVIVGGGIRTPQVAAEIVKAGADIIVTGTLVERTLNVESSLEKIVAAIKSAKVS